MVHLAKREKISRREISLEILVTRAFGVRRVERSLIARPSLRLQCRRIRCTFSPAAGGRAAVCSRRRSAGDAGCRLRAIKTSARGIPHLECTSLGCTRPPSPTTWVSALFPSPPFFLSPLHYASDTVVAPSPSSSLLLVSDITAASIFRFLLCPSLSLSLSSSPSLPLLCPSSLSPRSLPRSPPPMLPSPLCPRESEHESLVQGVAGRARRMRLDGKHSPAAHCDFACGRSGLSCNGGGSDTSQAPRCGAASRCALRTLPTYGGYAPP